MLCAQARCQISCVSSAGADLGWDCEQPWVGTGQALPRSASMKHSPHGHPSLWESCPPSVWLSRDRCGTGRSGAQVRGATTKQPFAGVRLLLSQDECAHGGQSWEHFGANHKQSWRFLGLWGERTQVCFRLTPKCGRGGGHVKHLGSFLPIFLREQACPWRYHHVSFHRDFLPRQICVSCGLFREERNKHLLCAQALQGTFIFILF